MNIWLINHYAVPTKYYPLARPEAFTKYLLQMGHSVTIFAASTVHNSDQNLITDGNLYKEDTVEGIHYVYIRDCEYTGNGIKRILNMALFPMRLSRVCKHFPKPDAILATSVTPMACMKGINLAKRYGCRGVAEIADLWPETFVAYGVLKNNSPVLKLLYAYEKRLYSKADAIVFTMEGGCDYIIEKGWDKEHGGPVELRKVHYINNGVDLETFNFNKVNHAYHDEDIDDTEHFKAVYTGAIRDVNGLGQLVKVAEYLKKRNNDKIRILIYGDGDKRKELEKQVALLGLDNIKFKGRVSKESIPSILSKADLCLLHWKPTPISDFGMSMNKFFEYIAAGKPVLSSAKPKYDMVTGFGCGFSEDVTKIPKYAEAMEKISKYDDSEYRCLCLRSMELSRLYDFKKLTSELVSILK